MHGWHPDPEAVVSHHEVPIGMRPRAYSKVTVVGPREWVDHCQQVIGLWCCLPQLQQLACWPHPPPNFPQSLPGGGGGDIDIADGGNGGVAPAPAPPLVVPLIHGVFLDWTSGK